MTNAQSIFAGAALIAVSIIAIGAMRPASANGGGPYQLMHHSNTSANAGVFRIDTSNGGVSYCYIAGNQALTCTQEIK